MRSAIKIPWKEPLTDGPTPAQERHAELVLMRLHALVQAGYQAKLGFASGGAPQIDLNHPNAQPLTLWPDGIVLDRSPSNIENDKDRTIIHCDDNENFVKFIKSVPQPNLFYRISTISLNNAFLLALFICSFIGILILMPHMPNHQ